jgi:hypothetical protein
MKNEKILFKVEHILQKTDTWDLGARGIRAGGLSDCTEGSWRD